MLMPLDFLLRWLSGLLTIALLGGAGYILYQWHAGELVSDRWRISQAIPQADLVVLAPGGHMGLMERHQQFAEAVRTFGAACLELKR
ncbi:MAG: hypothetical protein HC881_14860 [Leptolyngbyaceae cyanobacterium SL_7_1]|nr:hypothetical protein [Leptolyngbyaceae cyanobacterium SL_7_1]